MKTYTQEVIAELDRKETELWKLRQYRTEK